jgi:hypothetical protein
MMHDHRVHAAEILQNRGILSVGERGTDLGKHMGSADADFGPARRAADAIVARDLPAAGSIAGSR